MWSIKNEAREDRSVEEIWNVLEDLYGERVNSYKVGIRSSVPLACLGSKGLVYHYISSTFINYSKFTEHKSTYIPILPYQEGGQNGSWVRRPSLSAPALLSGQEASPKYACENGIFRTTPITPADTTVPYKSSSTGMIIKNKRSGGGRLFPNQPSIFKPCFPQIPLNTLCILHGWKSCLQYFGLLISVATYGLRSRGQPMWPGYK